MVWGPLPTFTERIATSSAAVTGPASDVICTEPTSGLTIIPASWMAFVLWMEMTGCAAPGAARIAIA